MMKNNINSPLLRWISFLIVLSFSIFIGSRVGKSLHQVEHQNSLDGLRDDYRTDIVLMVAEIYASDSDLPSAFSLIESIFSRAAEDVITDGIEYGESVGYSQKDIKLMQELHHDVSDINTVEQ